MINLDYLNDTFTRRKQYVSTVKVVETNNIINT